jgi:undecaprenyl-diphosphatase
LAQNSIYSTTPVGYGVIVVFLRIVSSRGYWPFVGYRIALGTLVLILLATGVLQP